MNSPRLFPFRSFSKRGPAGSLMFSSMEKWQPHVLMRNAILRASFDYRCAKEPWNRVSGFFYRRSKVVNLYTANLTATMGRYRNSCVWVCFVPIRKQSFDHPRSGFDTNTAMLPAWSFYDDCLRISSSGFLHIPTLYSWLLNLIISLILQGIRFGILTDGKTLSYQICSFSVFKFVLAMIRFSSLANLSFPV